MKGLKHAVKKSDADAMYSALQSLIDGNRAKSARKYLKMVADDYRGVDVVRKLLKVAIENHDVQIVEFLLNDILSPNFRYYERFHPIYRSPLDIAIDYDNPDMVRTILKWKADPNNAGMHGELALINAIHTSNRSRRENVQILISHKANPHLKNRGQSAYDALEYMHAKQYINDDQYQDILTLLNSY
jgi:ankyrin repeat protein